MCFVFIYIVYFFFPFFFTLSPLHREPCTNTYHVHRLNLHMVQKISHFHWLLARRFHCILLYSNLGMAVLTFMNHPGLIISFLIPWNEAAYSQNSAANREYRSPVIGQHHSPQTLISALVSQRIENAVQGSYPYSQNLSTEVDISVSIFPS